MKEIVSQFVTEGIVTDVKPLGEGFINDTYRVFVEGSDEPRYILQRKNHIVFPDVPSMMDNILRVSRHIAAKVKDPKRESLTVIPTVDGSLHYRDNNDNYWAMCLFISGSMSYDRAATPQMAYQGGLGLGEFHRQVADFKEPLTEVIKGFHNIRFRFTQWDDVIARDPEGRASQVKEEISWIESRRESMMAFWNKFETGEIPTRVTHNDTKISNFLFDKESGRLLCAIDLDTLMSSTLLNDTGDAIRSYTNTGAEDDRNLDNVTMSIDMFRSYMEGYMSQMSSILTKSERDNLAFSGAYITYEQVLRFLMDYIDGDHYYKTAYKEHNLVRTRAQYKLLTSIESQLPLLESIITSL